MSAGVEAERQVLVEPDAQVGLALRVAQLAVRAHLGAVLGPGGDLGRAGEPKLRVAGLAVRVEVKAGHASGADARIAPLAASAQVASASRERERQVRLAAVAARRHASPARRS